MSLYINGILFSLQKEGNSAICDNMDESWGYYFNWNKPDGDKYCKLSLIYGIIKKKVKLIEIVKWPGALG